MKKTKFLAILIILTLSVSGCASVAGPEPDIDGSTAETVVSEETVASKEDTSDTANASASLGTTPLATQAPKASASPAQAKAAQETSTAKSEHETQAETVASPESTWRESTTSHDITVDTVLKADKEGIYNFNDTVCAGISISSGIRTTSEADYGFTLTVNDSDSVTATFYNNSGEDIKPVSITAQSPHGDRTKALNNPYMTITGYSNMPNGFGEVTMEFSTGKILTLGVLKEDDQLYAANIIQSASRAENIVESRQKAVALMEERGWTLENTTSTDPIYYPIVPIAEGEKTDTAYWVAKSKEITKPEWTDAHKMMVFYNYCIDNFAYDRWIVKQGAHNRWNYYKEFTGKYFISQIRIGVCEDFSQVMAIMCRAQNIPALVCGSGEHAWNVIYMNDYNRWVILDITADTENDVWDEDVSDWSPRKNQRYEHYDTSIAKPLKDVFIGNTADMKKQGIPLYPKN